MRITFFSLFLVLYGQVFGQSDPCNQVISGRILDISTKAPLPFATVKLVETNKSVVADAEGNFILENICGKEVHLEVRFVGYKPMIHHHDLHHASPTVFLAADETLLESVILEDSRLEDFQSTSVQKKEISKISLVSSSVGDLTSELTGVSMLKTGSNISKPIIHGLHSNRVLVINDGVRHAYQVWGQEHSPEIDPSHIDQIEIVKGAATVKYGPEALGGVILYNSKRPVLDEKINGSTNSSYQTNGRAITSQLNLGQGSHRFAWNVSSFGIYQGDLQTPNYNLSNTGKTEYGGSFNTLWHQPKFDLQISGSYFQQELGILRGSIAGNLEDLQNAINRSTPNPTSSFTYQIANPRQDTEHGMLKSDFSTFLGDHVINLRYAFQQNIRREFDVRRGELNDRPIIDLKLSSHNFETEWIQPAKTQWSGSSGIQLFTQNSVNKPGSNPVNFVPDYDVFNLGAFTIQSFSFDKTTLELGTRFDFQSLNAADTIRETVTYANKTDYYNATFTLGFRKQVKERLSIFSNVGSAWRPPNVAELYSFGYHSARVQFGLWRYELNPEISTLRVLDESDRTAPSEKSIKWVSGIEVKKPKTTAEFIFYINHINDYIFLRPYGVTIGIAGTFPLFLYNQTNAFFVGSDWDIRFQHTTYLTSEVKIAYVYAVERENRQALIEIPPLNIYYDIEWKKGKWTYGLNLTYTAKQWHAPRAITPIDIHTGDVEINRDEIFDFMSPPKNYFIIGGKLDYHTNHWDIQFKVNNLLNSSYRIYTDRLRYFSDAPGRNFSLALGYNF